MNVQPEEETKEEFKDLTGVKNKDLNKKQKTARKAAKAGDYTDKNLDGIPDADQLDWDVLGADWQWVQKLMLEVDEIRQIVENAVANYDLDTETGVNNFINDVIGSTWWEENDTYVRDAFAQRATDPDTYKGRLEDAANAVRQQALQLGAPLDEATVTALAEQFVTQGWDRPERAYRLTDELNKRVGPNQEGRMFGQAGNLIDNLRQAATRNGLSFTPDYYNSALTSVNSGLSDENYWLRQIREEAASYWPSYSEQIRAGLDVMQLASGYMNVMARTLEIDPNSISLNDPFIRKATTGIDEAGNPRPMSLWEFEQDLRNDPRWMNTDQATKSMTDIGTSILQRFGIL